MGRTIMPRPDFPENRNKRKTNPPEPPKPRRVGDNEKFSWSPILWATIWTSLLFLLLLM